MNGAARSRLEQVGRAVWTPLILCAAVVVLWAVISYGVSDIYYKQEAEKFFLRLMIVLALQLFSGNSGVLSFGEVSFVAIGAYASALVTIPTAIKKFTYLTMPHFLSSWIFPAQLSPLEGTLAGAGVALVFALLFGIPIVRLSGVAAGIATLAILVATNIFIQHTDAITRGTSTQIGVPQTTTLTSTLIWLLIIIVAAYLFRQSRRGLRLRASRENDRAARSVGVKIPVERFVAFALAGFICGIAGALYGHYFITFSYLDFYFDLTFITIAMLVVGGMGSVTGALVGTFFLTVIYDSVQHGLEQNGVGGWTAPSGTADLVLAVALLLALVLRPKGLTGGREIPWPGDWGRRRSGDDGRREPFASGEFGEPHVDETAAHQSAADAT